MAKATMADLLKQADEAGISSWDPENGVTYELEIVNGNAGRTKKDAPKFGFQAKVTSGPDQGKSFWFNLSLNQFKNDGDPNAYGLALTFKDLAALGLDADAIADIDVDAGDANEKVKDATVGTRISAEAKVGQNNGFTNVNLTKIRPLAAASSAPFPAPSAETADTAPPTGNRPF